METYSKQKIDQVLSVISNNISALDLFVRDDIEANVTQLMNSGAEKKDILSYLSQSLSQCSDSPLDLYLPMYAISRNIPWIIYHEVGQILGGNV